MTYEAPEIEGAILRRIHDMLVDAMAEAGRILAGAGASPEEMLNMTVPFLPLMRLLRDSLEVRTDAAPPVVPSAPDRLEGRSLLIPDEQRIESDFLNRGSPASNVVSILRRR
jgi:hypothetical protein